ncbi:chemotaxis-specific protein-glutamate methyltransferase CheB [Salipiger mucosus]|uniref:Protein-glutamate methylesterase/protein-glutamine glutaminase n=1 Tax=Salipiger mucosus DSM 16094 TaxID=1123237 RepID=S9RXE4_9RHOB|nr:chemotaxis-specific protein-glutamate methyltransferase CheB [Salipiger mucosus]EPX78649.1 Chemotaxis response regulator protein-glutamate methylesterase CheB [Salipiger mucosus DSM 16094]
MSPQPRSATPISVMIVDDSASARSALTRLLSADPGITVMGQAGDAYEAAAAMRNALPDVLMLDLALPGMSGLAFLRRIMAQRPMPVVVCSAFTAEGSKNAMLALESGAAEVVSKPRLTSKADWAEAEVRLSDAVHAAASTRPRRGAKPAAKTLSPGPKLTADVILPPLPPRANAGPPHGEIIAIGASTGGTEALVQVLSPLPPDLPPIVIVQHMPEHFTRTFAERLDGLCRPRVTEAQSGDRLARGLVMVAPGNRHMLVRRNGAGYAIEIVAGECVSRHRPSVDVLFRSVAQAAGCQALGIVLTGMGDDGARGLLEMRQAGAETLVQDEATSVVFGMPYEALSIGAATLARPLSRLPADIKNWAATKK